MNNSKNKLLACLAGATLTVSSGGTEAAQNSLTEVPEELIGGGDTDGDLLRDREWAASTVPAINPDLDILTHARRSLPWENLEPLLMMVADEAPESLEGVERILVAALKASGGITRTRVISEWALSLSDARRTTVARALAHDFFCLGADIAAAHLAADSNREVRRAVVDIAGARMREYPEHYRGILHELSDDPDAQIRAAARAVLRTTSH